ncbi:MAG: twin-arginine translocase subunit TatB [Deltaproteobacteria bacterium]|nr:twin-arginine translocase subunit TatB [Deltaproteobacteria bacterium]
MFGIGFQEILLVLLIALIFFGPKKLPDLARSLGRGVAEFKKAADEVKRSFEEVVEEESLKKELKDELQELKDMGSDLEKDVKKEVGDLEDDLKKIDEDAKTADGKVKEFSSPDEG